MLRQCSKCKKVCSGSFAGAMAQNANPKNKIGYFGGYCRCGGKLSESYNWNGVELLGNSKKVYSSEWLQWRQSLSDKQHRQIFGGPQNATIIHFSYHEAFFAKNQKIANKKFLKLWYGMKRHTKGRCRVFAGSCSYYAPGIYCGNYEMETAGLYENIKLYLELKRQKLGVKKLS